MINILSRNKFLVLSLVLLLLSVGILLFKLNQYNSALNYFGNDLLGNGLWLHPSNKLVIDIKKYESFRGILLAMNQTQNVGYFPTSIEPYRYAKLEERFNFQMPTRIDLNNSYSVSLSDPTDTQKLSTNLVNSVPLLSMVEIDLQSAWNSSKYQEVVKLIVFK